MVAKMSSRNSLYGALSYNQIKVDEDHAKVVFAVNMKDQENGIYTVSVCLESFESRLVANRKTEKPVLHISLNPDPKDVLSDEQLSEIAQKYMQKTGYGDQPYIVFKHEDIEWHHLHIVSLRVDKEGKKSTISLSIGTQWIFAGSWNRNTGLFPPAGNSGRKGFR
jgi:hypothetical protein